MTVMSRGGRSTRRGRRPGWTLLTALLALAIVSSSLLVFTDRVELLKLAVILALWAAVIAAFVSVIYRRQSDLDQAKARDLKLVYDLQLDREISARREYELEVETQLRRELSAELRAQAADEVAALRAELAALRNNLEILFDADLGHRPALETERTTVQALSNWERGPDSAEADRMPTPAIAVVQADAAIIDVPEEPAEPEAPGWQPEPPRVAEAPPEPARHPEPQPVGRHGAPLKEWRPAPAEGQWLPPGAPGSNWVAEDERAASSTSPTPAGHGRHASRADSSASPQVEPPAEGGQHGPGRGQSVADLLARFQTNAQATGSGGRRRRRD